MSGDSKKTRRDSRRAGRSGIITLLTDFGLDDPYVGIMKGIILGINPEARLVDLSHGVGPGDVVQASILLDESYPFFPPGTVHLVVVDPGVGGKRKPAVLRAGGRLFVGPDNGVFWQVMESHPEGKMFHLAERDFFLEKVSNTFHGRDIFAPAAAHLSMGTEPREMGTEIKDPVRLERQGARIKEGRLAGRVIRVDRFGNLITNIHRDLLESFLGAGRAFVRVKGIGIDGIRSSYDQVEKGDPLAVIGSSDCLEIAVNQGRACDLVAAPGKNPVGTEVIVDRI